MPLSDALLSPLGLLALAALVPLVVLYLIQPDPTTLELPTLRFLVEKEGTDSSNPLLERLRRNALFLLQALAVVLFALALATPYVTVPREQTVDETVVVVDASASMGTTVDGTTRFRRAVGAARDEITGTTSVVVAGATPRVLLRGGSREDARRALDGIAVTDAAGDLRSAVAQATAVAGENARVVVLSDFADDTAWRDEVRAARGRGLAVELRQFDGGANAVGIVDHSFSGQRVTLTVRSYADTAVTRTVTLGGARRRVELSPGDVATVELPVPAGGGEARLSPGDGFPTDDVAYVAAPSDATVDVLLLTNDRNRYLATALSVIEAVDLTVRSPPMAVQREYDVIVYSNLQSDRLLDGNVEAGRNALERGGGVVIQAQTGMPSYGDLLPVSVGSVGTNPAVGRVAEDELTRDVSFPPPSEYLRGDLRSGRALVSTTNGTPLLAVEERDSGRVLYYGFIEESSAFKYDISYPVFWKRAVFYLAGRDPLPAINRGTGERLTFASSRTVETPTGQVTGRTVPLDDAGFYATGGRRIGVSLYSAAESNVTGPPLDAGGGGGSGIARETRTVPRPLDGAVALLAFGVLAAELAYLRRRGDL
ncbi:MAG: BatA and WFA domain-containing protein [Haloferacaceae archaeon]